MNAIRRDETRVSLGIIEGSIEEPLKPPVHHSTIVLRGLSGGKRN